MPELQIGDAKNAILYIQASQTDPQKAVAELVENSIDAKARNITVARVRSGKQLCLVVTDDGEGIPPSESGEPDVQRVATSICDSIKRKCRDVPGAVQGQFGIGLLGFAAIGEELLLRSRRGRTTRAIRLRAGSVGYETDCCHKELSHAGTEVEVRGVRRDIQNRLTAEKLAKYLADELRGRIRQSQVRIVAEDRVGVKKSIVVTPREFSGIPLKTGRKQMQTNRGPLNVELYAVFPKENEVARVSIARSGTCLLPDMTECDELRHAPWNLNLIEGQIDFYGLAPAPATRRGFLLDEAYRELVSQIRGLEPALQSELDALKKHRDEQLSKEFVDKLRQAFSDAMDELSDDYTWFAGAGTGVEAPGRPSTKPAAPGRDHPIRLSPGPLDDVRITPKICVIDPDETRRLVAKAFDPSGALIPTGVSFEWFAAGPVISLKAEGQVATVQARGKEGETTVRVTARLKGVERRTEARVAVAVVRHGYHFPNPDLVHAPLETWRSQYRSEAGVIEVNTGHRDYERAHKAGLKPRLHYMGKLYAKELVLLNASNAPAAQLLERMIEVTSILESKL